MRRNFHQQFKSMLMFSLFILIITCIILIFNKSTGPGEPEVIVVLSESPGIPYNESLKEIPRKNKIIIANEDNYSKKDLDICHEYYKVVIPVKNYHDSAKVQKILMDINFKNKITRIVTLSEFDLLRASRARKHLNIPGQSYESALAFRDKVLMKETLKKSGITVPDFKKVENVFDLIEFANQHSYPLILKPKRGAGASETFKLKSKEDIEQLSDEGIFNSNYDSHFEVEKFIDGEMYRVDGLVLNGKIVISYPSKVIGSCQELVSNQQILGSYLLERDNPLVDELKHYAQKVIKALPTPKNTVFHLEFFRRASDGEFVFCEIASRIGGPFVRNDFSEIFSVDLMEEFIRLLAGLKPKYNYDRKFIPSKIAAWMVIPKQSGIVENIPINTPFNWVTYYQKDVSNGEKINDAKSFIDTVALIHYLASDEEEMFKRWKTLESWFFKNYRFKHEVRNRDW